MRAGIGRMAAISAYADHGLPQNSPGARQSARAGRFENSASKGLKSPSRARHSAHQKAVTPSSWPRPGGGSWTGDSPASSSGMAARGR